MKFTIDSDTQVWLDADLTEPLPAYEWGPEGIPEGLPVQYVPGKGMIVLMTKNLSALRAKAGNKKVERKEQERKREKG